MRPSFEVILKALLEIETKLKALTSSTVAVNSNQTVSNSSDVSNNASSEVRLNTIWDIQYDQLKFDPSEDELGEGNFAKVYKGLEKL